MFSSTPANFNKGVIILTDPSMIFDTNSHSWSQIGAASLSRLITHRPLSRPIPSTLACSIQFSKVAWYPYMDDNSFQSPRNIMFIWRCNFSTRDKKYVHENSFQILLIFPKPCSARSLLHMRNLGTSDQSTRNTLEIVSDASLRFGVIFTPLSVMNQIIYVHRYRDLCLARIIKPFIEFKCSFVS